MRALTLFVSLLCLVSINALANPQEFVEGTHYEVLDTPKTTQPEIVEYFSLYCMACFRFEPIANDLKSAFPKSFRKSHMSGLSPQANMGERMTQAYALARFKNLAKQFNNIVFKTNFSDRNTIETTEQLITALEKAGINAEDAKTGLNSFSIKARARQMDKEARDRNVRGTPTLIVNGKYKININGFRNSNNLSDDLVAAINMLLKK